MALGSLEEPGLAALQKASFSISCIRCLRSHTRNSGGTSSRKRVARPGIQLLPVLFPSGTMGRAARPDLLEALHTARGVGKRHLWSPVYPCLEFASLVLSWHIAGNNRGAHLWSARVFRCNSDRPGGAGKRLAPPPTGAISEWGSTHWNAHQGTVARLRAGTRCFCLDGAGQKKGDACSGCRPGPSSAHV